MTRRFIVAALVVLCGLTVMTASAFGQAVYGSILGTITDPSGAAVAGAKVTVTSVGKGTTAEATTNADGNYTVSGRNVGQATTIDAGIFYIFDF